MFGLCVEYISNAFAGPSFNDNIAKHSSESNRGRVYGLTRGFFMLVTVLGPVLAGFLVQRVDFRRMLMVAFIFYLLATLLRIWMATSEGFSQNHSRGQPGLAGIKIR